MSDLNPKGELIVLGGEERHFLFTFNVIDDLQDHFEKPLEEIIDLMSDETESVKTFRYVVMALLNDEVDRADHSGAEHQFKKYSEKEVGWLITRENELDVMRALLIAYGLSIPEPDEYESPNEMGGQKK